MSLVSESSAAHRPPGPPGSPPTPPRTVEVETVEPTPESGRSRVPRWVVKAASPIALVVVWQVLGTTGVLERDVLAPPLDVLSTAGQMVSEGRLQSAVLTSLGRVAVGLVLGIVTATVLATVTGLLRRGEDLLDAPMQMLRTIPVISLIPLLIVWFGIGEEPKVVLIGLAVTFPLYMNLFGGIRNVDAALVEAARTLGLGRLAQVRHVILPAALPQALVGLRYSFGSAWLALVFGETINATSGIGYEMNTAREYFQTDVIVVCLVLYALLGLAVDLLVRGLERGLLSWRPAFSGQ
ncbi:ABC transporter permease [Pseudonocardia endophytica]|uniref:Sulfonate transport system permease protein n=1 Tax=Pseudonocardia endophytica TaxID=401976 RepID=A0A4R1HKY0_PSEEN|nr:ABC transporter permease [Pseudonocardia endophytica]TCK20950.1 sulfonate transport system permease protein [Pseudonocardia endophytica]